MNPFHYITFALRELLQVFLLAVPLFYLLKFLRRTRGYRVLWGLLGVFAVGYAATKQLDLEELAWIFDHMTVLIPIALITVFQPELRRIFADIGGGASARDAADVSRNAAQELHKAVMALADAKCGALVAVERAEKVDAYVNGACHLGAPVVAELVETIFYPGTALHDGGIVVSRGVVAMAGCIFPLGALGEQRHLSFGTRHRAAIGLTEKTDAVVFIVSEESGMVSVAFRGELVRGLGPDSLRDALSAALASSGDAPGGREGEQFERVFARLKEDS